LFSDRFFVWISSFFPEPPLQRPSAGNYTELPLLEENASKQRVING